MATQHNFRVKNGLEVAGVQRISSTGVITGTLDSNTTATTQSALDNSTKIATTAYTDAAITAVIGGAPGTLDTLNELAAAINDDDSYATTLTTALAGKMAIAGGTFTGNVNLTKETPYLNLTDSSASRTLGVFVDDNNSVLRSSGPLLLQVGTSSAITIDSNRRVGINQVPGANNFALQVQGVQTDGSDARSVKIKGFGSQTSIGSTGPTLVIQNANTTANNYAKLSFESGSAGETVSINAQNIDHTNHYGDMAFNTRGSSGYYEKMRITSNGIIDINKAGSFSSYPTGSQLNVYANGEGIRLDGSGATSRNIRFRNVSDANPGVIIADGSLKLETEDANTDIRLSAVRDIEYQVTSGNSTAGFHYFKSYNTYIMAIDGGNNRVGINTTLPSSELHVNKANADSKILIQSTGAGNDAKLSFLTHQNGRTMYVDDSDGNKLHVATGYGEANVRDTVFDNEGRVGIRQTDIADTLHVSSVDDAQHLRFRAENGQIPRIASFSGTSAGGAQQMDISASRVRFETGSTYGGKSVIDGKGRFTGRVMDMVNVGSDDWSDSCYYNDPAGGGIFGYGTGGSLGGYSVNAQSGQAAYWYAGLSFSGYVTWIPPVYMPYSIGQVYGLSCTLWCHHANTAGTAVQYVGCIGYDSNFNFMNHDAIGTYQYNLASSASYAAQTRYHMDVTLKGWNDNGQSDGNKMDRGTVYIRPMMLINYPWSSSSGGTTPLVVMESFTMGPKHTISDNDSNSGTNY